jgi:hypothetical protein
MSDLRRNTLRWKVGDKFGQLFFNRSHVNLSKRRVHRRDL